MSSLSLRTNVRQHERWQKSTVVKCNVDAIVFEAQDSVLVQGFVLEMTNVSSL